VDVPAVLVEVTQVWEATAATNAAQAMTMLAAETSSRKAIAVWDSTTLHVEGVEDWAALAEREALERVSRSDAKNATTLASACEDVEGFVGKIALHEDKLMKERQAHERERPITRFCDVLLWPPPGRARLTDHLDEVVG
jgi:uncharacterized hydantoinase/oxoprolinase family protein